MAYRELVKEIVIKEINNNLHNLRFTIGSLLILIASVLAVVIMSLNYQEELTDYHQSLKYQDEAIEKYAHLNRIWSFVQPIIPPSDFHPIIQNKENDKADTMFEDNGISNLISPFDLITITGILLSLLAILFSYDSISGEREDGTLKLLLSNHLPRPLLLTGKWIGGTITIWAPYLIMLVIVAIILLINPNLQWDQSHWISFLLIGVAGLIYLSLFFLVGMLRHVAGTLPRVCTCLRHVARRGIERSAGGSCVHLQRTLHWLRRGLPRLEEPALRDLPIQHRVFNPRPCYLAVFLLHVAADKLVARLHRRHTGCPAAAERVQHDAAGWAEKVDEVGEQADGFARWVDVGLPCLDTAMLAAHIVFCVIRAAAAHDLRFG